MPFCGFRYGGANNNKKKKSEKVMKFPLAPMGVLAPVSAHAGHSAQTPIDTSGNFPAPVSAEWSSNISPSPSKMFQTPTTTPCRFSPKLGFCPPNLGRGGAVKIFKNFFWSIFSPNKAILRTFYFFSFFGVDRVGAEGVRSTFSKIYSDRFSRQIR